MAGQRGTALPAPTAVTRARYSKTDSSRRTPVHERKIRQDGAEEFDGNEPETLSPQGTESRGVLQNRRPGTDT